MKFFAPLAFVAALAWTLLSSPVAHALITGIAGPTHVLHPGNKFHVTFFTADYIQNNLQYYALFGISPGAGFPDPTLLGYVLGSGSDLVLAGHSNTGNGAYNVTLTIPKPFGTPNGATTSYILKTAVLGTIGAGEQAIILTFNTTIRISPK